MGRTRSSSPAWTGSAGPCPTPCAPFRPLTDRDIGLQALDVDLDTSTATGRLMLNMLLMLANWERDLLRERTREGLEAARRQGRVGGRPRALEEKDQAAIKAALEAGLSVADVARMHGVSARTISRVKSGTY